MSDTTSRDQLAADIGWLLLQRPHPEMPSPNETEATVTGACVAGAVAGLGWRPPARVVTTVEELDALAVGTVIMEGDHGTPDDTGWGFKTMPGVFHRFPDGWHVVAGIGEHAPDLPATVLWEPEEGE